MQLVALVHGTNDSAESEAGSKWWQSGSEFSRLVESTLDGDGPTEMLRFRWSGANSYVDRMKAASRLSAVLDRQGKTADKIVVLAHSHGGNVALAALRDRRLKARVLRKTSVVTYGTPFFLASRRIDASATFLLRTLAIWALLTATLIVSLWVVPFDVDPPSRQGTIINLHNEILQAPIIALVTLVVGAIQTWRFFRRFRSVKSVLAQVKSWDIVEHPADEAVGVLKHLVTFQPTPVTHVSARRSFSRLMASLILLAGVLGSAIILAAPYIAAEVRFTVSNLVAGFPCPRYVDCRRMDDALVERSDAALGRWTQAVGNYHYDVAEYYDPPLTPVDEGFASRDLLILYLTAVADRPEPELAPLDNGTLLSLYMLSGGDWSEAGPPRADGSRRQSIEAFRGWLQDGRRSSLQTRCDRIRSRAPEVSFPGCEDADAAVPFNVRWYEEGNDYFIDGLDELIPLLPQIRPGLDEFGSLSPFSSLSEAQSFIDIQQTRHYDRRNAPDTYVNAFLWFFGVLAALALATPLLMFPAAIALAAISNQSFRNILKSAAFGEDGDHRLSVEGGSWLVERGAKASRPKSESLGIPLGCER